MVNDWPFTMICLPTALGSAPRRDRQNALPSTATGCPPIVWSSFGVRSRPSAGETPRVGKYEPETWSPWPFTVCRS
jgi:hypothetical protein